MAFTSPLVPGNKDFAAELEKHGDGVKDVAFTVDDAAGIFKKAVERGAKPVKEPEVLKDEHGSVVVASV
jgi:4-hydroxyphenylpyruvate dioxygenase